MSRDLLYPQWKLPVPWEPWEEIRPLTTQWKLPVPCGLRAMRRDFLSTRRKLPVPWEPWEEIRPLRSKSYRYLESHEKRFVLYAVKANGTLTAMRRDSPFTPWKLLVPWESWGEIRTMRWKITIPWELWEDPPPYAVKDTGTFRAMRRDSPSTPWKLLVQVPWEPWGEIRPLRSERTSWRSRDRWSLCHRSSPLRAAPSSVPAQKYVTNRRDLTRWTPPPPVFNILIISMWDFLQQHPDPGLFSLTQKILFNFTS